jgi:hypothetical protein
MKSDYTREELVAVCERAVVPVDRWTNRDSASAQENVGRAWALLRADCEFTVQPPHPEGKSGCFTDDRTVWFTVRWPGFTAHEYGVADLTNWDDDTFYLPTPARLEATIGRDWY